MKSILSFLTALDAVGFDVDSFNELSEEAKAEAITAFVNDVDRRSKGTQSVSSTIVMRRVGEMPPKRTFENAVVYPTAISIIDQLRDQFGIVVASTLVVDVTPITIAGGTEMYIAYIQPMGDDGYTWRRATLPEMLVYHLVFGAEKDHKTSFTGELKTYGARAQCYAMKKKTNHWSVDLTSLAGNILPTLWVRSEMPLC